MTATYRLGGADGKTPVPCDPREAPWNTDRTLSREDVGAFWVSTVFLVIDHQFSDGPPLLFETMIFRRNSMADLYCRRCSTYGQAIEQHCLAVTEARKMQRAEPTEMTAFKLTVELTADEVWALAEWCKRQTWEDLHARSVDQAEHDAMQDAFTKIRRALAEHGIAPR